MSENPYLRAIRLFDPSQDLAVDETQGGRRVVRKSAHPAAGLLDDELDTTPEATPPEAPTRPAASGPPPEVPEAQPATDKNEKYGGAVIGETPEPIEGDFPEPVDL
ncbi:MAG: hypothetical protein H7A21_01980 [Spirochaetales bacterium]|nr:hypothetical protein [Leptospiraceae bacterium]MCP5480175.1 hypothetical protein [Spirochaetales bacterium]MCP5485485.1 hypothetical protein [Spirochaetales bacterium]